MVELTKQLPEQRAINAAITELHQSTEVASKLPTKDDLKRATRRSDRNRLYILCGVALISIIALAIAVALIPRLSSLEQNNAINTGSIEKLQEARDQLRAAGVPEDQLPPVVPAPAPGEPVDVDALVNATAATILAKIRTDPAYRGAAGLKGDVGDMGPQGRPGEAPACLTSPTQCQGAEGRQGPKGDEGERGLPGESPPCLQEATACRGERGEKGDKGDKGDQGPVCPDGITPTPLTVLTPDEETPDDPNDFKTQTILACIPGGEGP